MRGAPASRASRQAAAKTSAATTACASVMISGGENRMLFLPHSSRMRPRLKHSCATAPASSGVASSTPIIRPTPRISVTIVSPDSFCCRVAFSAAPTRAEFAQSSRSSRSTVASPAAIATGLPAIVEPWLPAGHVITSFFAIIAPSGMPDAIPLAASTTSGTTPVCSAANILPVRPMPLWTSSNTRRMPWRSAIARSRRRNSGGGTM